MNCIKYKVQIKFIMGNLFFLCNNNQIWPDMDATDDVKNPIKKEEIIQKQCVITEDQYGNQFYYNDAWQRYQHR